MSAKYFNIGINMRANEFITTDTSAKSDLLLETTEQDQILTHLAKQVVSSVLKQASTQSVRENTEPVKIKLNTNNQKAKSWIEKVYKLYPTTMLNNHVMLWGEGDDQQMAVFELTPSFGRRDSVEVKWFQAYPLRQGVGSKAMRELQRLAKEDNIQLTLYPWDKGQVSQSKLMKFYKTQGFKPIKPGVKNMIWSPENSTLNEEGKKAVYRGLVMKYAFNTVGLILKAFEQTTNTPIAYVKFAKEDKELYPQDLWVNDDYRNRGIAKNMYDFLKNEGYIINRSHDQTKAGSCFWDKHRGEDVYVWENEDES
jgi:hypothetical protein